jgi:glycosyltransferase involved in cell wall biosynthesis
LKTKIGYVVNNLTIGGVSSVLINLVNALDPNKYEIHLFVLSADCEMEKKYPLLSHINKHVINYPFVDSYSLISYLKNSFFLSNTKKRAKKLLAEISSLYLDILHFHTLPRQLTIGILAKKNQSNIQLIFTDHELRINEHDYNFHQRLLLGLSYRKLYKHYHLIPVSKSVEQYITKFKLKGKGKIVKTLENSVDTEEISYKEPSLENTNNVLLYIARICKHKEQQTLIKAWKKAKKNKGDLLYLVGPDESNGEILSMAENDPSIIFTGKLENTKELLNNATIGVFPSSKEGLPISLLEKMAKGLPLIVSDIPELTDIIRNGIEGIHFEMGNSDDLALKIEHLLASKILRKKLGNNARKRVEYISMKNNPISFHEVLYQSLLSNNN